ncbi:MAG: isochorismate synthase [Myxococcota bacterium]|nr:isochorismate synthase [Myxococcota bacterium]
MIAAAHHIAPSPHTGLAFFAFSTPVTSAAAIAAAFPDEPLVTWSSSELVIAGIGIARELRGTGAQRWRQVIEASRMPSGPVVIDGVASTMSALGFARPRFLGGAAFAPGAADRAPWQGFGDAWFVLPRWTYTCSGGRAMIVLATDANDDPTRWQSELARLRCTAASSSQPPLVELQPAPAAEWRNQVTAITDAIARGECSKVVAARTCGVALAGNVDASALLAALDDRHADCVRVLVRPPHAGTLVAATPERLVRVTGGTVECDALAGTISISADDARAKLLASTKDRREHALVVDAIRTALEDAGASVAAPVTPDVRALRHVLHLHTPFHATLREPRHVLELVARLHPTPAVGGTPATTAIEWIQTHEPSARGWYSSPVGWFDFDGNGEFAVAIRSGVLVGNRAHLYAGAGIVAGSDPDRELAETDAKLRAMLGALGVVR